MAYASGKEVIIVNSEVIAKCALDALVERRRAAADGAQKGCELLVLGSLLGGRLHLLPGPETSRVDFLQLRWRDRRLGMEWSSAIDPN